MLFAEKCQVESEEWWKEHALNVGLVVQCTTPHQNFNYPPRAAISHARHVRVDPRSERFRQRELDTAVPLIQTALINGQDVIFHCMQSFHRAPVTAAAAHRRVMGGCATVRTFSYENIRCGDKPDQIHFDLFSMIFIVNLIGDISIDIVCGFHEVTHSILINARNHEPIDVIHRRSSTGSRL